MRGAGGYAVWRLHEEAKDRACEGEAVWEQEQMCDGLDLPEEDFDYDEFVAREFGHVPHKQLGVKWYWWWIGVVLLVVMAMFSLYLF